MEGACSTHTMVDIHTALRVASDCSGMCVPEMALKMLCEKGKSMHTVFVCDVMKGHSSGWLISAWSPSSQT